ncbi:MAG: amidase, partial [Candidatus Margulisiibacteriota bacterium]
KRLRDNLARPLEGILVGVKDIYNTIDFPTQMGSVLWKDFTPGNDARTVYYLKEAGAIIAGKTVTAEFAVHELNKTLNPYDISKTPGTSSSGSAVAVALGVVPVALGTQTAGSIIRPASFCGTWGYKPSFGTIPRTGMLKTTDSLDTIGFFTSHPGDLRTIFDILRVRGPNYPFSYKAFNDPLRKNKPADRPWRVGFVKTHTWRFAPEYAQIAMLSYVERLSNRGDVQISEVELPAEMLNTHAIHETIYNKSLSYYFKAEAKSAEHVSDIMNQMISTGAGISVEAYLKALSDQVELCQKMDEFMKDYDVLVCLSTAGEAPDRGVLENPDPALMWTLTYLPSISAPFFTSPNNLPFGMQIVSRRYNDYLLLNFLDLLTTEP